jgi:hypothetical protein
MAGGGGGLAVSFLRPEVTAALHRWREVIGAGVLAGCGLWLATRGGVILPVVGALAVAAGGGLALTGWRRLRFASRAAAGPGIVEVDEGQVGWFGPGIGGFVALAEVRTLSLVTVAGIRCWRLDHEGGGHLLIPLDAAGAGRLFDAFAALPGLSTTALVAAAEAADPGERIVWRRAGAAAPTALPLR